MFIQKKPNFVDPTARLIGEIALGEQDYIGPYVKMEAAEGFSVQLSSQDNLQDSVRISATTRTVFVGERTSIAHGAQVINAIVGNFVFVGFNALVEDAVLEDGVMVQHGARVVGVTIPRDRVVPPGAAIDSPSQVEGLPRVAEAGVEFKHEVVAVNREFADGYAEMVLELGEAGVKRVGPNPRTTWTAEHVAPILEHGVNLAQDVRLIGSVQLGSKSSVGSRTSIRADEGIPIVIGSGAWIGSRVTFHALKEQAIRIGAGLAAGDGAVLHGALTLGDRVSVGSDAVVFKSVVGSQVHIGKGAIVVGVRLADGACVPEGARVLDQAAADKFAPSALD
jgi:carbon dioxide concentrating mechanism protein CcmM